MDEGCGSGERSSATGLASATVNGKMNVIVEITTEKMAAFICGFTKRRIRFVTIPCSAYSSLPIHDSSNV
jgi:hypothetical protein